MNTEVQVKPLKQSQRDILMAFESKGGENLALDEIDTYPPLLGLGHQAMGGVLGSLKRRGYVVSKKGKNRIDFFDLTEAGRAILAKTENE